MIGLDQHNFNRAHADCAEQPIGAAGDGSGKSSPQRGENLGRFWSNQCQSRPPAAHFFEFHFVHDDVVIEMTEQHWDLIAAGVEKQIIGAQVNITIALNPSLRTQ